MEFIKKKSVLNSNYEKEKLSLSGYTQLPEASSFASIEQSLNEQEKFKAELKNKVWPEKTILIVEDESSNYKYIEALLRDKVKIIWTKNGLEAVKICSTNIIDLVLMDIKLPQMNGYEATRRIKENNPKIPVIAVTAYAMDTDKQHCFDAGCDSYISKPFKMEELFFLINNYIG